MKYTKLLFVSCFLFALQSVLGSQYGNSTVRLSWYYYDSIADLAWSGQKVVFLLTRTYELYRSEDEGQTWVVQFQDGTHNVAQIHQDPLDDKKFIFIAGGLSVGWITVNAGQTYELIYFGITVDQLLFNPRVSGTLLTAHCVIEYNCNYYVSTDFARSFTGIGTEWVEAQWGELAKGGAPTTVYAVDKSSNFGFKDPLTGGPFSVIFKLCLGFLFTQNHLFVLIVAPDNMRDAILMVSTEANTVASSYKEAQFPFGEDLPQYGFVFLDDSTGGEWMGVTNHPAWGTVYTSDSTGVKYTTTLKHVYQNYFLFDFAIFQGLQGIYIANNVSNYDQTGSPSVKTTVITFDNGGEWRSLAPPKVDSAGNPISCTGKCSLHLHGINDWVETGMGPFYSSPNAIGLLIATGNIGESLVTDLKEVNLYFSRDAGYTWNELMKGPHIYEFGDHGGIIVFADTSKMATEILYTLDEGLSIQRVNLEVSIDVANIIVEPSGTSHKFILYGKDLTGQNVVIGIDFAGAQSRICTDSDYEAWSPSDGRAGENCQLGRTVTYLRRKRDADCFNDRETEHISSVVNCPCALEDYECDFGFEESIVDGERFCVLSSVNPPVDPPAYCPRDTTYEVSAGHRLVAGDTCVGELADFKPTIKHCPDSPADKPTGINKALVAVVVIFVFLAVIGIVAFFVYRNDVWKEKLYALVGKVIPINQGPAYSRLGRGALVNDEEFGIGGDQDLDDSDVEEDAPELQDHDIQRATATEKKYV